MRIKTEQIILLPRDFVLDSAALAGFLASVFFSALASLFALPRFSALSALLGLFTTDLATAKLLLLACFLVLFVFVTVFLAASSFSSSEESPLKSSSSSESSDCCLFRLRPDCFLLLEAFFCFNCASSLYNDRSTARWKILLHHKQVNKDFFI